MIAFNFNVRRYSAGITLPGTEDSRLLKREKPDAGGGRGLHSSTSLLNHLSRLCH
jgi:hypothetical protein